MMDIRYINQLKDIEVSIEKKYKYEVKAERNPEKWGLILECIGLIIAFVISTGLKVKWYSPIVIWNALKLIKKIVALVIEYLKKK